MASGDDDGAVVLSFQDAIRRRLPRVPDATVAADNDAGPAAGSGPRRFSVVGEDGAEHTGTPDQPEFDDGPDIA